MGLEGWSNPRDLREEWRGSCIRQNVWREVAAASVWERLDLTLTACISSPPPHSHDVEGASYSWKMAFSRLKVGHCSQKCQPEEKLVAK